MSVRSNGVAVYCTKITGFLAAAATCEMRESWAAVYVMFSASCSSCAHDKSVPTARITSSASFAAATAAAMPDMSLESTFGTPSVTETYGSSHRIGMQCNAVIVSALSGTMMMMMMMIMMMIMMIMIIMIMIMMMIMMIMMMIMMIMMMIMMTMMTGILNVTKR